MTRKLRLPDAPSPGPDARMSAPSALRNMAPILNVLRDHAPDTGKVLEIASGTGEHALAFASTLPGLRWQPTDMSDERLASIAAWRKTAEVPNLLVPIKLDATTPGWSAVHGQVDVVILVNLLHLISAPEAAIVLSEIAKALAPGGKAFLYGPFLRDGIATSDGDARFHASLQAQDPAIGYKDLDWIKENLSGCSIDIQTMPANNLLLIVTAPV